MGANGLLPPADCQKHAVVIGAGVSGLQSCRQLLKLGWEVGSAEGRSPLSIPFSQPRRAMATSRRALHIT
jgi:hypothetical protein